MNGKKNSKNIVQWLFPISGIQTSQRIAKIIQDSRDIEKRLADIEQRDPERVGPSPLSARLGGWITDGVYAFLLAGSLYQANKGNSAEALTLAATGVAFKLYVQNIINGGERYQSRLLEDLRQRYNSSLGS